MPDGFLVLEDGEYEGEFKRKLLGLRTVRHGLGRHTWPDGTVYDGW